jgi:hypothetical protein
MQESVFILTVVFLVFLFHGEPDAWDALHAKVMGQIMECPQPAQPKKGGFYF